MKFAPQTSYSMPPWDVKKDRKSFKMRRDCAQNVGRPQGPPMGWYSFDRLLGRSPVVIGQAPVIIAPVIIAPAMLGKHIHLVDFQRVIILMHSRVYLDVMPFVLAYRLGVLYAVSLVVLVALQDVVVVLSVDPSGKAHLPARVRGPILVLPIFMPVPVTVLILRHRKGGASQREHQRRKDCFFHGSLSIVRPALL